MRVFAMVVSAAIWLLCASAQAQVALDAFGFQDTGADRTTNSSTPVTVGTGSQRELLCSALIGGGGHNISNVHMAWGTTSMTLVDSVSNNNGAKAWAGLFSLTNPASGKQTLKTTWAGANGITVACWSLTGVNQTAPIASHNHASGTSLTPSIVVPSVVGDLVIAALTTDANSAVNSISGTVDFIQNDATGAAGSHTSGAAPSVTTNATITQGFGPVWAMVSVDVAVGSPPPPNPPVVSSVTPNAGPTAGGTSVSVAGSGFTGATSVLFGSVVAPFTFNSDSQVSATSPAESANTVDVTVTTGVGTSQVTTSDKFTYSALPLPAVTGISPNSGAIAGGTSVTITGTNLTGATAVNFGSMPATSFAVASDTQITAIAPAEAAGTVDITVATPAGTSPTGSADQFTYQAPPPGAPTVTSVTPNNDASAGGDTISIMGTKFTGATAVNFGSVSASFSIYNDINIVAVAPPGTAGMVDITVVNPSGTSVTTTVDQFTYGPPPTVPPIPTTASRPSYNTGTGFFVVGRGIYDANGNLFTPIGANRQYGDASELTRFQAKPNVERNVPFFNTDWATQIKPLMDEDVNNKVVPIPTVFYTDYVNGIETTGKIDLATLNTAVGFWTSQAANWTTYNNIAMFNIANEWGPCTNDVSPVDYQTGYISAVQAMRQAGYTAPLVIDAGCSGEGPDLLVAYGPAIEAADPLHNVVFSIHIYGGFYSATGMPLCAGCGFQFVPTMDTLAQLNVPVIIGEFGCGPCEGTQPSPTTPDQRMQTGELYQLGWLAWSWDDGGCQFNLLGPCPNNTGVWSFSNLSAYGTDVITSPGFGMQAVSKPATVFP